MIPHSNNAPSPIANNLFHSCFLNQSMKESNRSTNEAHELQHTESTQTERNEYLG